MELIVTQRARSPHVHEFAVEVKVRSALARFILPRTGWCAHCFLLAVLLKICPYFCVGAKYHIFTYPGNGPSAALALLGCILLVCRCKYGSVCRETLVVMHGIGVQLRTVTFAGTETSKFVDVARIQHIVINEAVTMCRVVFYICLILAGDDKMCLAFENLRPRLQQLKLILKGTTAVIRGETKS